MIMADGTWQVLLGVADTVARMEGEDRTVPAWVKSMLAAGRTSFYALEGGVQTYWDPIDGAAKTVPMSDQWLNLHTTKANTGVVKRNGDAALVDIGDGVLLLEFTKPDSFNALEQGMFEMYSAALDLLDADLLGWWLCERQVCCAVCCV